MGEVETQENLKGGEKNTYLQEKKICWEYILFFDFCKSLSIILWIVSRRGRGRVREDRI